MYRFRPFGTRDPPHLARIWNRQPPQRGLAQPVTPDILESLIFSRLIFDPRGLIVAEREGTPIGFVHAGFGPEEDQRKLSTEMGVTCMLLVDPSHDEALVDGKSLATVLLSHSEAYLRDRGSSVFYGGGIHPLDPFYRGVYGGSEMPGVLVSDPRMLSVFQANGYQTIDRVRVYHLELSPARTTFDRRQLQVRRATRITTDYEPRLTSWWETVTTGEVERTRFELADKQGGPRIGTVMFWNLEPLASCWGIRAAGLVDLTVEVSRRRGGLATSLLSEAFRRLQDENVTLVEVQTMESNRPAIALYEQLGFRQVDEGHVLRRQSSL